MSEQELLRPGERIDDLQLMGLRVIQSPDAFRFSMDSVLLSDFARVKNRTKICDLGTGTGILPLLLYGRAEEITCDAIEIQPDVADRARRTMRLNGLEGRIAVYTADLRKIKKILPHGAYQLVISNPPYNPSSSSLCCPNPALCAAREEACCTLDDIAAAAAWLLKSRGRFVFMLPAARLSNAIDTLRQHRLEPKRLRFVHGKADRPARLMLMEAMLDVNPGLLVEAPLIAKNADGTDTDEVRRIYHMTDTKEAKE